MADIYKILADLEVEYDKHDHPPFFTCAQADAFYEDHLQGGKSKNLLLRNRAGNKHYLVIMESDKHLDLKALQELLGESKLSFASPERLMKHLKLTPGAVSPFGLINDEEKAVEVIVDEGLMANDFLHYHPNVNTSTLVISSQDFKKFLAWTGNKVRFEKL